jgi:ubiquinol-cytochrome c reductase cytochrome b subunit
LSINELIWFFRIAVIVLPPVMFLITKRICLSLQRRDRDKLLHGYETGRVLRLPHGEFIEVHGELSVEEKAKIMSKSDLTPLAPPAAEDASGVRNPKARGGKLRTAMSRFFLGDTVARPTDAEIEEASHHIAEDADLEAPLHEQDALLTVTGDGGVLHRPGQPDTNREQIAQRRRDEH